MHVGIIQSNYIPWRGYFDFIDDVDLFVLLDDVQYSKGTWRNRNKVKLEQGSTWITVPVLFRLRDKTAIDETPIDYSRRWVQDHQALLTQAFKNTQFFEMYSGELFAILRQQHRTISELNVALIRWISNQLSIKTKIVLSRGLGAIGDKTDRVLEILSRVSATSYLSGRAAEGYLEIEKFRSAGIDLYYKEYDYCEYPQQFGPFDGVVTALDLLFNCGPGARRFLKSGKAATKISLGTSP